MKKLILFIACAWPLFTAAQGINFHEGTWKEAQAQAKKEKKLIFVDYYATWCGPCKYMSAAVFTRPEVGDYFNAHFINVKIDAEKEYPELVESAEIEAYPTLVFYTPSGEIFARYEGGQTAEDLLQTAARVNDFEKNRKAWKSQPSNTDLLMDYLSVLTIREPEEARNLLNAYLDTIPVAAARKPEIWQLVEAFETQANSRFFLYTVENVRYFLETYETFPTYFSTVTNNLIGLAIAEKSEFLLEQYKRISETVLLGIGNTEMQQDWPTHKREVDAYYYRETEQYAPYLALTDTLIREHYGDFEKISSTIDEVIESVPASQGGSYVVSWAQFLYAVEPDQYSAYTLANAYRYAGNKEEALRYAREAFEGASDQVEWEVFRDLVEEIEKMK